MPNKKLRLEFRTEHGANGHVALCACEYKAVLQMAGRKLRISNKGLKQARFVIESTGETIQPDSNLERLLSDGNVIVVYKNSNKKSEKIEAEQGFDFLDDLPPLAPGHHYKHHYKHHEKEAVKYEKVSIARNPTVSTPYHLDSTKEQETNNDKTCTTPTMSCLSFDGPFPVLEGNLLALVRESISDCSGFVERDFGEYLAFDYKDAPTFASIFPNPKQFRKRRERWLMALRRECRGLLLCAKTGRILRRPFHKFFNLYEMEETHPDNIPSSSVITSDNSVLLEKLDGSLVSPLLLKNKIVWASRKSFQPKLQEFCESAPNVDYQGFARFCIEGRSATPLFEWCEADQAVGVVRHDETCVTLLAIRDMITGRYYSRKQVEEIASKFGVPCVNPLPTNGRGMSTSSGISGDVREIAKNIAARPAPLEGGVLIVDGCYFYKIKTLWYVSMASAAKRAGSASGDNHQWSFLQEFLKGRPSLEGIPSERIWKAALCDDASTADDSRALCKGLLADNAKQQGDQLQRFCRLCDQHIHKLHAELCGWGARVREANRKDGSLDFAALAPKFSVKSGWSGKLLRAYMQDPSVSTLHLRKELLGQSISNLESKFGLRWDAQAACVKVDENIGMAVSITENQEEAGSITSSFGELFFNETSEPEIAINPNRPEPKFTESNEAILRSLICFGKLPSQIEQPIVIVLRGLPGSGKSSWAKALRSKCGGLMAVVGADSFFESSRGYNFDPNQRGAAHDHSRAMYMEALQQIDPRPVAILVDNTNSKRSEYKYYVRQGQKANKRVLIVEMLCRSEDDIKAFHCRGLHNVPERDMGRMHGRWEVDEEAFLFRSDTARSGT